MREKFRRRTGLGRLAYTEPPELSALSLGDLSMAFFAYGVLLGTAIIIGYAVRKPISA